MSEALGMRHRARPGSARARAHACPRQPERRHRFTRGTDGFTLLEVTIALAMLGLLAAALIPSFAGALAHVATSQQRRVATSLLTDAMESVRALPFATLANGLDTDDITGSADPRISVVGGAYTFSNGEAIPHGNLDYTVEPLVPHRTTKTVDGRAYTVSTYPTQHEGASDIIRVTVVVEWETEHQPGRLNEIRSQSVIYSDPEGCLSSATHPFAAPCQPFLYANASSEGGSILVTPAPGATTPLGSIDLVRAELDLPAASSAMQVEQITSVTANSVTGGAIVETASTSSGGGASVNAGVDDDPGSASGTSLAEDVSQAPGAASATDGTNSITVAPGSTDAGNATSTVVAAASPPCSDLNATTLTTSRPCSSGRIQQTAASVTMNLDAGGTALGATTLASIGTAPATSRTFTSRHLSGHPTYCTTATGDGCVHAGSRRAFGTIDLAGLPERIITDGAAPAGWTTNALVRISDYGDLVTSERGIGAAAPSASQISASGSGTPTLSYWNGSGYTTLDITWGATNPTITIPTVSVSDASVPGGTLTVTISATVETGAATATTEGPAGCAEACQGTATVSSPLIADIVYTLTHGTQTLADLNIRFDLGSNTASTSYRAAPSAG